MKKKLSSMSITFKMSLYMAMLITFLMTAVGCGNYFSTRSTIREQVLQRGWSMVQSGSSIAAEGLQSGNQDLFRQHLQSIRTNDDLIFAAVINAAGVIVGHTDQKLLGAQASLAASPPAGKTVTTYADSNGKTVGNIFTSPITGRDGKTIGYYQIGINTVKQTSLLNDIIINMLLISFAAVVAGIMLARVMAGRILRHPINDLMEATEHIAAGDFAHQVPVRQMDELGSLSQAFNTMTGHLANLFMSVRTSASELTKSSQIIINLSENFRAAAEKNCRESGDPGENSFSTKKQLEALQEITSSARRVARLVDRLNGLSLQFKL
ncbi:MAG: HAMP domain-containing protein [Bacillota bacterium]